VRQHFYSSFPSRACRALWVLLGLVFASAPANAATVHIDRARKYQTVEGFGFFGAQNNYWGDDADLVDERWVRLVIDDLGLSMWRNELYPPEDDRVPQDADWDKQRPVVEALRDQARASGVPLRTIVTVWSPPADMKCASDQQAVQEGIPHFGGARSGGAVCPGQRARFADWLIAGLKEYAEIGVPVYGLSFQNEPLFAQGFNSGVYPPAAYADTLALIGPRIRARFPRVKLFGSENLLEIETGREGGQFDPYWYTANILANPRTPRARRHRRAHVRRHAAGARYRALAALSRRGRRVGASDVDDRDVELRGCLGGRQERQWRAEARCVRARAQHPRGALPRQGLGLAVVAGQ
jgi:hypothetical protein